MATSILQFNVGLYREHLEDASFLYEQRLAYLHDPEVNWPDLQQWEERFEAHIDALVVGGDLALETCRQLAVDGEAGVLHAALRLFCRQNRRDDAFSVLDAIDPANDSAVHAAAGALCHEAPTGWRDDLLRKLQSDERLRHLFARVVGYRRFPAETILRNKLAEKPSLGGAELAWALGRVGTAESLRVLAPLIGSDDDYVCEAAAIASMRLGDDRPLQRALQAADSRPWARRVLGIGGSSRVVRRLLDLLRSEAADAHAVIALGLLGDLGAVAPLLDLLGDEKLGGPAAVALNTITGAALHKNVFVPDKIDPDELSDEEREAYQKDGTLPTHHGRPLGNWECRPLRDKADWYSWLDQNKHRFSRQYRWRMGRPHGPAALVECLKAGTTPYVVRAATYEELVVRFGLDVPFEVDLPVSQQWRSLTKIDGWVARHSGNFDVGRSYFARQLQS
jgi:uncharacterized protein (TIGR02270 family)